GPAPSLRCVSNSRGSASSRKAQTREAEAEQRQRARFRYPWSAQIDNERHKDGLLIVSAVVRVPVEELQHSGFGRRSGETGPQGLVLSNTASFLVHALLRFSSLPNIGIA